ncbi:MAG: S-layer protein domain-containing protein [Candidatus Methanoperedens sp.]|nr:S-layer protein domain-containing protein [Candidatus Methanoperedens sp.]
MMEYDNKRAMILAIGYLGLMILLIITLAILPVSAAIQTNKIEIRGTVMSQDTGNIVNPSWDAQSFAGFFYDIKNNQNTEYLNITGQDLSELNITRAIEEKNLIYQTGKAMVEFKVHEKEGLNVIDTSEFYKDTYPVVGWKGEKWIAVNGNANKLTKLAFEMGKDDKKNITTGETWALSSGYELTINAVDVNASPSQVRFSLMKEGALIDDGISSEKNVYYKTQTIMGESNALLFTVYVDSIFPDMVQFKYAWLTDADSAIEINTSDTFDAFKVIEANKDKILLENDRSVSLSKNTDVKLFGDIAFKIADSDNLRFYPKVDYVIMNYSTSPRILVKTPNKGENWLRGTTKKIKWSSIGDPGTNVKIELLKGGLVNEVIASSTPNDGSFSWNISATHVLGSDYKISIESIVFFLTIFKQGIPSPNSNISFQDFQMT